MFRTRTFSLGTSYYRNHTGVSKSAPILHGAIQLSPSRTVVPAGTERLLIVGEDGAALLEGAVFAEIGRLLPVSPDFEALRLRLQDRFEPVQVEEALEQLAQLRVFTSRRMRGEPVIEAYWESAGICLPEQASLRLLSLLAWGDAGVTRALEANGLHVEPDAERTLVITDDYLRPELFEVAAKTREWILVRPVGHTVWIGPLFARGETVCFECLSHWLSTNRGVQCSLEGGAYRLPRQPALSALPSTVALGASLAATAAANWIARGEMPELRDAIVSLDTRTLDFKRHRIRPSASCRCLERSVRWPLIDLVSPICGIVSRLNVTNAPQSGFFCARAQVAPPLPVQDARPYLRPIPVSGRGPSYDIAETTCIGEAVERYSSVFQGCEKRVVATIEELGDLAIDPSSLFLFSEEQYIRREAWNCSHPEIAAVPHPFDPAAAIEWTQVEPLAGGVPKYVPSAYCYLWYASRYQEIYCADSNGCAAGPDRESATLSALLELVERDSLSIWWDNRLCRPGWDPERLENPQLLECREALWRAGRDLHLLDITTDLEIPSCVAVAARHDGSEPYFAAAADLDPSTAAARAAAELAYLLWIGPQLAGGYLHWVRSTNVREHPYLEAKQSALPPARRHSIGTDRLNWCVDRLLRAGLEPGVVDLTRPEIGVPAVRAIVPGLRHPWGRRAEGRLNQVPIRLGWLSSPRTERQFNSTVCML